MSGFIATKYCMDNQLYARIPYCASENSYPVRQLIGQVSGLGDSFVVCYYLGVMIRDPAARAEILQQWGAVRKLCSSDRCRLIPGVGYVQESPPESFYNLPFLLAYATLDQVLSQMIDEGIVTCPKRRPMLGDKMAASATAIPWQGYCVLEAGRIARNALAHDAVLLSKSDCLMYIGAVEGELSSWGLL